MPSVSWCLLGNPSEAAGLVGWLVLVGAGSCSLRPWAGGGRLVIARSLSDKWFANIFIQSLACLFATLFNRVFHIANCFKLDEVQLTNFFLLWIVLFRSRFKNSLPRLNPKYFFLYFFPPESPIVFHFTFKSAIHFELI